jgi:hypothetical protein
MFPEAESYSRKVHIEFQCSVGIASVYIQTELPRFLNDFQKGYNSQRCNGKRSRLTEPGADQRAWMRKLLKNSGVKQVQIQRENYCGHGPHNTFQQGVIYEVAHFSPVVGKKYQGDHCKT